MGFCLIFHSFIKLHKYFCLLCCLISVYFFYEPLSNIELREGETVKLSYELSTNRFPVSFWKDNQFVAETTNIKKRVAGRTKELKFRNVAPSNAGQYRLKVEGNTSVKSHLTKLLIHRK